jgi:hypothetical protein
MCSWLELRDVCLGRDPLLVHPRALLGSQGGDLDFYDDQWRFLGKNRTIGIYKIL